MKRIKLLLISALLTTFMVFTMTSCLNSDDGNTSTSVGIVQVSSSMGSTVFKFGEYTLVPSSTSLSSVESNYNFHATSGMAFIQYTYDTSTTENKNYETTKILYVDVTAAFSMTATVEEPTAKGASNDSTATAAIHNLASPNGNTYGYYLYNDGYSTYLITGINYYLTETTANAHYFTLVYYPNNTDSGDTTLNLYLRHRSSDTTGSYLSYTIANYVPSYYYKAFDLTQILLDFADKSQTAAPTKIIVHTDENQETGSITNADSNTYELEYKTN
jgi:hypothetical protein